MFKYLTSIYVITTQYCNIMKFYIIFNFYCIITYIL
nr:MAG TPA: hypothetical protein [Caudoviricetes sp.]